MRLQALSGTHARCGLRASLAVGARVPVAPSPCDVSAQSTHSEVVHEPAGRESSSRSVTGAAAHTRVRLTRRSAVASVALLTLLPSPLHAGAAAAPASGGPSASASAGGSGSGIADASRCSGTDSTRGSGALPLDSCREPAFSFSFPCGWKRVDLQDPVDYGVLASIYNPREPGLETVAVYAAKTEAQNTEALGSAQQIGQQLADIAPFGELQAATSFVARGTTYYLVRVMFGGNTAGKFGSVIEYRCVAVRGGVQYTLRATTSRYRHLAYPEVPAIMDAVTRSFQLA
ncbi:hypothetical protein FOA52_001811 [Chlamydomonas sp. UWO 241]|nr:hypothetical protein FOA52_001811 [Chlamydomonas sp. UWO 241]